MNISKIGLVGLFDNKIPFISPIAEAFEKASTVSELTPEQKEIYYSAKDLILRDSIALKLKQPEKVIAYLSKFSDLKQEVFIAIYLNNKMKVIAKEVLNIGSIDSSLVDIQRLVRDVCKYSATSIIVAHNHPSGECEPSQEDEESTRRIAKSMNLLGVKLVDHVIIGDSSFFSFQQKGLL